MAYSYYETYYAVLQNLKDTPGQYKRMPGIFAELGLCDPEEQLGARIEQDLCRGQMVAAREGEGVMILKKGIRALSIYKK